MRKALAQPHTKQFLKFAVVGLISFGIDWGMLIALVELFHLDFLMSTTVSFITSVVVNYWLSMKYVFDHREGMSRKREFTIFTILSVIGLGLKRPVHVCGRHVFEHRLPGHEGHRHVPCHLVQLLQSPLLPRGRTVVVDSLFA